MARNEHLVKASPQAVFDVLADPRGYAYWVVGSQEIRDADLTWPARGSRFHHTVKIGPLRLKDDSEVEDVRPGQFLQLKTRGRPLGTARVKLELERADGGTRVTMSEHPGDTASAFIFMPLTHLLVRARNVRSLDRLAELAEGRVPMPGDEPGALNRTMYGDGHGRVENPLARERREALGETLTAVINGVGAGFAGAIVMSISTNTEMCLRGRPPSDAPAKVLSRLLGLDARGKRRKMQLALAGHLATSVALGAVRGVMARRGVKPPPAGAALFTLAMLPEVVVVPALGAAAPPWRWSATDAAISVLHHGVFALSTNAAYGWLEARAQDAGAS